MFQTSNQIILLDLAFTALPGGFLKWGYPQIIHFVIGV